MLSRRGRGPTAITAWDGPRKHGTRPPTFLRFPSRNTRFHHARQEGPPMSDLTRREFIEQSGKLAAGAAVASGPEAEAKEAGFASRWEQCHDRVWLGPEYWANPLQDWRLAGGRIECVHA